VLDLVALTFSRSGSPKESADHSDSLVATGDRPLNIAHLITGLSIGGAEMMLCKLLSRIDRDRFRSHVLSLDRPAALADVVRAVSTQLWSADVNKWSLGVGAMYPLTRQLRRWDPDVLHAWMLHGCFAATLVRPLLRRRIPLLWNIRHCLNEIRTWKTLPRMLIRILSGLSFVPDWIVYNSHASARQHEAIGFNPSRTRVIPNGFDGDLFRPDLEARLSVRQELGLGSETELIGLIARLHPVKDHHTMLKAAALLAARRPGVHFLLAGRDTSTSSPDLQQQIERLGGLAGRIHGLGERADVSRITAALDVATCCSTSESFPNVLGEAMACGVPCVSTDVGDARLIVEDTGSLIPMGDPFALSEAWNALLAMGPQSRMALGAAARRRILRDFSLDAVARSFEELYEDSLGRG